MWNSEVVGKDLAALENRPHISVQELNAVPPRLNRFGQINKYFNEEDVIKYVVKIFIYIL